MTFSFQEEDVWVQFPSLFAGAASRNARFRIRRLPAALAIGLALVLIPAAAAQAAVFVVTTTADGNNGGYTVSLCTLRDAVIAANASPGSSITLPSNANPYTLTLTGVNEQAAATGDLDVTANLTINGGGAQTTIIDGNAADRVFEVIGAVTLTLNNVTVRNGSTAASAGKSGGGINAGSGTVVLSNSVLSLNNGSSGQGGGIIAANVTLTNSTVIGNTTSDQGGGIFAISVTVTNSTIINNTSTGARGAAFSCSTALRRSRIPRSPGTAPSRRAPASS
jgi:CSLREA domain-containing protein